MLIHAPGSSPRHTFGGLDLDLPSSEDMTYTGPGHIVPRGDPANAGAGDRRLTTGRCRTIGVVQRCREQRLAKPLESPPKQAVDQSTRYDHGRGTHNNCK